MYIACITSVESILYSYVDQFIECHLCSYSEISSFALFYVIVEIRNWQGIFDIINRGDTVVDVAATVGVNQSERLTRLVLETTDIC